MTCAEAESRRQDERLNETLHTNVNGYFYMARAALPHLKKGSCIINTGSVAGGFRRVIMRRVLG